MSQRVLRLESDGGSRGNPGPAGYGSVVRDPSTGKIIAERAGYLGQTTNNVAEYHGLVTALETAIDLDPEAKLDVHMDSRLLVEQMSGRWKIKNADMQALARQVKELCTGRDVSFTWEPRANNKDADRLANEAMDKKADVARDFSTDKAVVSSSDAVSPTPRSVPTPRSTLGTRPAIDVADGLPASSGLYDEGEKRVRPSGAAIRFNAENPTTVLFIRHGETPLTMVNAYSGSGQVGPGLGDIGQAHVEQGARLLRAMTDGRYGDIAPATLLLASPMARTRDTAQIVGKEIGLEPQLDPAFAEANFGVWEAMPTAQIEERWPGQMFRWHTEADFRMEGGESRNDLFARVKARLGELVVQYPGQTIVVASHCTAVRAAIGVAIGAPANVWGSFRILPASITGMHMWGSGKKYGQTEVLGINMNELV